MPATKSFSVSESFRARADSACFWEAWVGAVLSRAGLYTVHEPFTLADETGKRVSDYAKTFDLQVGTDADLDMSLVEVKSLNLDFTSTKTYPFEEVMVCSQKSFLNKWPGRDKTGRHFLLVSRATGSVVWIPPGTKVELGKEVVDSSRNELYKVAVVKKTDLRELSDFCEVIRGVGK